MIYLKQRVEFFLNFVNLVMWKVFL